MNGSSLKHSSHTAAMARSATAAAHDDGAGQGTAARRADISIDGLRGFAAAAALLVVVRAF